MGSSDAVDARPQGLPEKSSLVAIQGEPGSNSHLAVRALLEEGTFALLPRASSQEVFEALVSGRAACAVLPIENSLHGAVFEHYDLLLEYPVRAVAEHLLHVHHNVIAMPGVRFEEIRQVLSHPVALSQCRRWVRSQPAIEAVSAYDTAGSVKQVMAGGQRHVAAIAPHLAAETYGAEVLVSGIEDHPENYTRFLLLEPAGTLPSAVQDPAPDKLSLAFSLEHRPGTLIEALRVLQEARLNLTKIESRPVPGKPWEYIFFVDLRFEDETLLNAALAQMSGKCVWTRELGRYKAALVL